MNQELMEALDILEKEADLAVSCRCAAEWRKR